MRGTYRVGTSSYFRLSVNIQARETQEEQNAPSSIPTPIAYSTLGIYDYEDPSKLLLTLEKTMEELQRLAESGKTTEKNSIHDAILTGTTGTKTAYKDFGYGQWFFAQQRYLDACINLEKCYEFLLSEFHKMTDDEKEFFIACCITLAQCHSHIGNQDETLFYADLVNTYKQFVGERMPDFQQLQIPQGETFNRVTIGYILHTLYSIHANQVKGMIITCQGKEVKKWDPDADIWDIAANELLADDTTIVIPYSLANYDPIAAQDREPDADQSQLYSNNSIILRCDKMRKAASDSHLMVTVMIPNFTLDNTKHSWKDSTIGPKSMTFVYNAERSECAADASTEEIQTNAEQLFANKCYLQSLFEWKRLLETEHLEENRNEICFHVGYCLADLTLHKKALRYLALASSTGNVQYLEEYVNALCNSTDIRAISYIDQLRDTVIKQGASRDLKSFMSFLSRRKAYTLIDLGLLDEAKAIFTEMLKDPASRMYAAHELNYIEQLQQQK